MKKSFSKLHSSYCDTLEIHGGDKLGVLGTCYSNQKLSCRTDTSKPFSLINETQWPFKIISNGHSKYSKFGTYLIGRSVVIQFKKMIYMIMDLLPYIKFREI